MAKRNYDLDNYKFSDSIGDILPLYPENNPFIGKIRNETQVICDFKIKEEIGEGTFAVVKLAVNQQTGEKVAIKEMCKDKILYYDDKTRVEREISILKRLRHPNIVHLYSVIQSDEKIYLIMEYVDGIELFDYIITNKRLGEEEACKFFQQILSGIEYLHKIKIVHRDIKPENLLLNVKSKKIKIVDFGLSNRYHSSNGQLLSSACGSPSYAAPEMLGGEQYKAPPVDIWSAGIVLYAMLCGFLPFEHIDNTELYKLIREGKFSIPYYISEQAKDLLNKILVTDPEKRLNISQIKNHPWIKAFNEKDKLIISPGLFIHKYVIPLDEDIINIMNNKFNLPKEEIRISILSNMHNDITTLYYLYLKKRSMIGKKSIADLEGELFRFYLLDKENLFSNYKKEYKELVKKRMYGVEFEQNKKKFEKENTDNPFDSKSKELRPISADKPFSNVKNNNFNKNCLTIEKSQSKNFKKNKQIEKKKIILDFPLSNHLKNNIQFESYLYTNINQKNNLAEIIDSPNKSKNMFTEEDVTKKANKIKVAIPLELTQKGQKFHKNMTVEEDKNSIPPKTSITNSRRQTVEKGKDNSLDSFLTRRKENIFLGKVNQKNKKTKLRRLPTDFGVYSKYLSQLNTDKKTFRQDSSKIGEKINIPLKYFLKEKNTEYFKKEQKINQKKFIRVNNKTQTGSSLNAKTTSCFHSKGIIYNSSNTISNQLITNADNRRIKNNPKILKYQALIQSQIAASINSSKNKNHHRKINRCISDNMYNFKFNSFSSNFKKNELNKIITKIKEGKFCLSKDIKSPKKYINSEINFNFDSSKENTYDVTNAISIKNTSPIKDIYCSALQKNKNNLRELIISNTKLVKKKTNNGGSSDKHKRDFFKTTNSYKFSQSNIHTNTNTNTNEEIKSYFISPKKKEEEKKKKMISFKSNNIIRDNKNSIRMSKLEILPESSLRFSPRIETNRTNKRFICFSDKNKKKHMKRQICALANNTTLRNDNNFEPFDLNTIFLKPRTKIKEEVSNIAYKMKLKQTFFGSFKCNINFKKEYFSIQVIFEKLKEASDNNNITLLKVKKSTDPNKTNNIINFKSFVNNFIKKIK